MSPYTTPSAASDKRGERAPGRTLVRRVVRGASGHVSSRSLAKRKEPILASLGKRKKCACIPRRQPKDLALANRKASPFATLLLSVNERRMTYRTSMADTERGGEVIKGTLDLLVLKVLQLGPMHGWGITELIEQRSENLLSVNQGSLYPALYRLVRQGLIRSAWKTTENNRRARFYELTAAGTRGSCATSARSGSDSRAA